MSPASLSRSSAFNGPNGRRMSVNETTSVSLSPFLVVTTKAPFLGLLGLIDTSTSGNEVLSAFWSLLARVLNADQDLQASMTTAPASATAVSSSCLAAAFRLRCAAGAGGRASSVAAAAFLFRV